MDTPRWLWAEVSGNACHYASAAVGGIVAMCVEVWNRCRRWYSASPYTHCKKCCFDDAAQHGNCQSRRRPTTLMSHRKQISDPAALALAILGTDTADADIERVRG